MKSVLALLLAIPVIFAVDSRKQCYRSSSRTVFEDGAPRAFEAKGRQQTCPKGNYGCGSVSKLVNSKRLIGRNGTREDSSYNTRSYRTLDTGCTASAVCRQIVGSSDNRNTGCKYATYSYIRYDPTSCNATSHYDAERYIQSGRLYYKCCNADNCANPVNKRTRQQLDSDCTENTRLSSYLKALYTCWGKVNIAFRKYFVCEGLPLYTFREECSDDTYGEYDRNMSRSRGEACYYRPTCSAALQKLIKRFGECACNAATSSNFTGNAIGSLMESLWSNFCPDVELSCAGPGRTPFIRRRRKKRRIKFRIKKAIADITDAIKESIGRKVCAYLRRQYSSDDVKVTATAASDGTSRRLLAGESDITVDVTGDEAFDEGIASDACDGNGLAGALGSDITGGTLTFESCKSEDAYETVSGSDGSATTAAPDDGKTTTEMNDSGAMEIVYALAVFVGLMGHLMQ